MNKDDRRTQESCSQHDIRGHKPSISQTKKRLYISMHLYPPPKKTREGGEWAALMTAGANRIIGGRRGSSQPCAVSHDEVTIVAWPHGFSGCRQPRGKVTSKRGVTGL